MIEVPRIGFVGLGEVITEYAYSPFRELADRGEIKLTAVADKNDLTGTTANLNSRREKHEKQRKAIDDILPRLHSRDLLHYQTNGDRFSPGIEKEFFDNVDIVYIATPNNARTGFVQQAVQRGKAIALEKPIGHTMGVINNIVGLVYQTDSKAACTEHYSYKDPSLRFFETFHGRTKKFGKILSIDGIIEEDDFLDAERYSWILDPSISGGGVWLDLGVHLMHLLYFTGAEVASVKEAKSYYYQFPTGDPRNSLIKSETGAEVFFRLRGNNGNVDTRAFAHLRTAKCKPYPLKCFKVAFEKGDVVLDFLTNSISYLDRSNGAPVLEHEKLPRTNAYQNFMLNFKKSLNNGGASFTSLDKIKPSTDAVFETFKHMKSADPRFFY